MDSVIDSLMADGIKDFVILTCKTESTSILREYAADGKYMGKFRFTSCRKFKGLEADAVILIDLDEETFSAGNVLLYYVGTSRAKLRLEVITTLTDDGCTDILRNCLGKTEKIKKPKRDLARALNALAVAEEA